MGWKKDYLSVAESLSAGSSALGGWKLSDMTVGLSYLAEQRKEAHDPDAKRASLAAFKEVSAERLRTLEWACDLAEIAYAGDVSVMKKFLLEKDLTLVHGETQSKYRVPAYYWAYDKQKKHCVFGVRGTASRKDMLTDLDSKADDFEGWKVHRGMMQSAKALYEKVSQQIADLAEEGFHIFVVGHSLGAGTASLLSILFKTQLKLEKLTCYAIATPPVADAALAAEAATYVHSVVCNDDIVCRLSVDNIRSLNEELVALEWEKLAMDDFKETRTGQMATYVGVKCVDVGKSVGSMKVVGKAGSMGKKAVGKAGSLGKMAATKAASALKPKIGSLTNFASSKLSKMGLGKKAEEEGAAGAPEPSGSDEVEEEEEEEEVQLFPPGQLVYLNRHGADGGVQALAIENSWEGLSRIELSDRMLKDHFLESYFECLQQGLGEEVKAPELVYAASGMYKKQGGKKALVPGLTEWKEVAEVKVFRQRRSLILEYSRPDADVAKGPKVVSLKGASLAKLSAKNRPFAFCIDGEKTLKLDPGTQEVQDKWFEVLGSLLRVEA